MHQNSSAAVKTDFLTSGLKAPVFSLVFFIWSASGKTLPMRTSSGDVSRLCDTVIVCGKGHETTQTIGDEVIHFDDRETCARF